MKTSLSKKGFTLVETMVAISILMLAITGPLMLTTSSLRNALVARDTVTAYYLAQEGIEFVRYVRDDNYIKGDGWLMRLGLCLDPRGCFVDIKQFFDNSYGSTLPIYACGSSACINQMYITSVGYYTYTSSGNIPSKYNRVITIAPVGGSNHEVIVTSTISWSAGALGPRSFSVSEHVFDIYQNL